MSKRIAFIGLIAVLLAAQAALGQAGVQHVRNGVQLQAGGLNVRVQFYADNAARVVK